MKRVSFTLMALLVLFPLIRVSAQTEREIAPAIPGAGAAAEQFRLATSSAEYPVTPGDLYTLRYQQGNAAVVSQLLVDGDYSVSLGVFGSVNAGGMTFLQFKQSVQERILAGYPRSMPTVSIASLGLFTVQVKGETPESRFVSAWGLSRVSDVIRDASSPSASMRNVEVLSRSGESTRCDLFKALRLGDGSQDPFVKPGDTVVLYRSQRSVQVAGEVFRPGTYELLPGEQLGELLNVYGAGLTSKAEPSRARIQSMSGDTPTVRYISLSADSAQTLPVENGDIVTVPAKTENQPAVFFEGAVIPQAGSPRTGAGTTAAGAVREEAPVSPAGSSAYNTIIHPFTEGETLSDALRAISGTLSPLADLGSAFLVREDDPKPRYIDMRRLITSSASPSDLALRANDRIVIPPFSSYVTVQGAVFTPGSFTYRTGLPAWYYIGLAGGIDPDRNSDGKILVSDAEGKARAPALPLRPGDTIFVPSTSFWFNLNKFAPLVTVVATIVGTTITVLAFIFR
jgi:polysaccharide biosynthesis/export protein